MPEAYEVQFERKAQKRLDGLVGADYDRLEQAIDALAFDPRPRGCVKLKGRQPTWRIRVGEYRVLYAVFDADKLVKILDVVRRSGQTYR